jgi:hypothetical protein
LGSQRITYSAPTMAIAKLRALRLRVEQIISPPGAAALAGGEKACGSGDVLDHLHVQHDVECSPASASASAVVWR